MADIEIKALTDSLKEKVRRNKQIQAEKAENEAELLRIMRKNYEELYLTEYKSLVEIDELLSKETKIYFQSYNANTDVLAFYPSDFAGWGLFYKGHEVTWFGNKEIGLFSDIFLSVDSTSKFLDSVKKLFAERFRRYEEKLDETAKDLREGLADVLDKLSRASCTEMKENGTIEITIGGKTYIGTVKEA